MEVVEKELPKKTSKKREQNLKGLLYKKGMLERQIKVAEHGANVSCEYATQIETRIEEIKKGIFTPFEVCRLQYELLEVKRVASIFISDFKEFKTNYENGVKFELKKVTEEDEFSKMEFENVEKKAQELVKYELFGTIRVDPENVEHPKIINDIEEYIAVLDALCKATKQELETNKSLSEIEIARLKKDLFDYSIHLQTLNKRLSKRKEYYYNQFMPQYNKDMADCEKNLDKYLEAMDIIIESGCDPIMKFMKEEYEKHKSESEQLWKFFTALRDRLNVISIQINRSTKLKKQLPKIYNNLKSLLS